MSNSIEVTDVMQRAGMLRGTVDIGYKIDVVVDYSGKGDRETLEMILKAQALEKIKEESERNI